MLLSSGAQHLCSTPLLFLFNSYPRNSNRAHLTNSLHTTVFRPRLPCSSTFLKFNRFHRLSHTHFLSASSLSNFVEQVSSVSDQNRPEGHPDCSPDPGSERFAIDERFDTSDLRRLQFTTPVLEVKDLEDLPENWRRSKLAWLCKELPSHKRHTMSRILNAQKKWMRQEDATYVAVHCMRIRENEAGFWVYKWMVQQHWFKFEFALATKLADYMGREQKYAKCREIFDDIINQGRVPCESTFHILVGAYISANCLMEACDIYYRMIQLGGYQPRLSLHNALFRALVSKSGSISKQYLRNVEFIFHNLLTSGLEVHKDIYGGLIWLHSHQDVIDSERISSLRKEMQTRGFEENRDVLLSVLRAYSKVGDVKGAEETWLKLAQSDFGIPSEAFLCRMEAFGRASQPLRSLEIFRDMQKQLKCVSATAYLKIIEILCETCEIKLAEILMTEIAKSYQKLLTPAYVDIMNMYFRSSLYDKVESLFSESLDKCSPNRAMYYIYLDSLVHVGNVGKAEMIFERMLEDGTVGVDSRACNTILRAYFSCGDHVKAEKIYYFMCHKRYVVESSLIEKVDCILSSKKVVKKPLSMKLNPEQREILVGFLLGGLEIEGDKGNKKNHLCFRFRGNSTAHSVLKTHVYDKFYEWLHPSIRQMDDADEIPTKISTISHNAFTFYANQFRPNGQPMIPRLVHRWLSPRVLAYWYMYSGYRNSSGGFLLKMQGNREGVQKVVKALKALSLDLKIKKQGRVFWLGLLGTNSAAFSTLIEPYVLDDLKNLLTAKGSSPEDGRSSISDSESDEDPE